MPVSFIMPENGFPFAFVSNITTQNTVRLDGLPKRKKKKREFNTPIVTSLYSSNSNVKEK
jgi:hypothetical protein